MRISFSIRYVLILFGAVSVFLHLPAPTLAEDAGAHIACPEGSSPVGAAPPKGLELKCVDAAGNLNGPYRHWYANGQLMESLQYKAGKEHGEQQTWWPNGQRMMQGTSVNGKRYKVFQYWDINGNPRQIDTPTITSELPLKPLK